jgi:hypothetical protein
MSSVTIHALEVAGFVAIVAVLMEVQLASRRATTPDVKPDTSEPWSYRRQWARIRYEGAHGTGIIVIRAIEIVVIAVALIVALISALTF